MPDHMLLDVDLPSSGRARVFVSEDVIGVLINERASIAHRQRMDAEQLASLAQCITKLSEPR